MPSDDPEVEFSYRLVGPGWSEARFAVGDQWVGLTASYLTDALGDLVAAVYDLIQGSESAHVSWALEPGEYRWLFARIGESVEVRILSFDDDYFDHAPEAIGDERLAASVPLAALARAIVAGANRVLEQYGETSYRERWIEHPFPTATLTDLETALASSG